VGRVMGGGLFTLHGEDGAAMFGVFKAGNFCKGLVEAVGLGTPPTIPLIWMVIALSCLAGSIGLSYPPPLRRRVAVQGKPLWVRFSFKFNLDYANSNVGRQTKRSDTWRLVRRGQ